MSDTRTPVHGHRAHVVVHPVVDAAPPFRRVDILGIRVGDAYHLDDVVEFVRRAGLHDTDPLNADLVEWIDGGPDIWQA
ncbi:hypothetical protein [Streptacidiphilus sp. EB129]|uniref:hypothetical protein n=1 Tax=Streptacidiphilus sp. EB129 TaxID=3156262 RepID=UPI003513056C